MSVFGTQDYRKNRSRMLRANYAEKIMRNAISLPLYNPASSPIFSVRDINIEPQAAYKVIDKGERGELIYCEVATNSTLIIPEIKLWNDVGQPVTIINDITLLDLLKLGRGMTPGRVQPSAPGQTQDEEGFFIPNMFHIARYKDDTLADWTDEEDRYIVGRFVASIPFPYSTITFYIKNTTTDGPKHIYSASVARTVYEAEGQQEQIGQVVPENVGTVEIEGEEIEVGITEQEGESAGAVTNVDYNVAPPT
jgi:hypothetical protein